MSEIVDLNAVRSLKEEQTANNVTGAAVCLDCKHEWTASLPIDMYFKYLDCPSCGLSKARYKYPYLIPGDHFECHCGNDLFHVMRDGMYCPNCGESKYPYA